MPAAQGVRHAQLRLRPLAFHEVPHRVGLEPRNGQFLFPEHRKDDHGSGSATGRGGGSTGHEVGFEDISQGTPGCERTIPHRCGPAGATTGGGLPRIGWRSGRLGELRGPAFLISWPRLIRACGVAWILQTWLYTKKQFDDEDQAKCDPAQSYAAIRGGGAAGLRMQRMRLRKRWNLR